MHPVVLAHLANSISSEKNRRSAEIRAARARTRRK
jgi:hypothetical protein